MVPPQLCSIWGKKSHTWLWILDGSIQVNYTQLLLPLFFFSLQAGQSVSVYNPSPQKPRQYDASSTHQNRMVSPLRGLAVTPLAAHAERFA